MKKFTLTLAAVPLALSLAACGETATDEAAEAEMENDTAMEVPVDDTMSADGDMIVAEEEDGVTVSASEDGVTADVRDGDTSISADIDGDPSASVETN